MLVAGDGLEDPPTGNFLGDLTDNWTGLVKSSLENGSVGDLRTMVTLLTTYERTGVMTTFERINSSVKVWWTQ